MEHTGKIWNDTVQIRQQTSSYTKKSPGIIAFAIDHQSQKQLDIAQIEKKNRSLISHPRHASANVSTTTSATAAHPWLPTTAMGLNHRAYPQPTKRLNVKTMMNQLLSMELLGVIFSYRNLNESGHAQKKVETESEWTYFWTIGNCVASRQITCVTEWCKNRTCQIPYWFRWACYSFYKSS